MHHLVTALDDARLRTAHVFRWVAIAIAVGLVSGLLSAAFLESLNWATRTRGTNDWLVWLLPLAGLAVGLGYHFAGRALERGNNLIIEQIHSHSAPIPLRMAPLIFVASTISHLAGASVGREGAALQLAAGVTDPIGRRLGMTGVDRSLLLVTAIAGGFGSIVGAPVAGAVFALEVQRVGRVRYEALVPAFVASIVANATVGAVGVEHTLYPSLPDIGWSWDLGWRVVLFGSIAGLIALSFVRLTHLVRDGVGRVVSWPPLRPAVGGAVLAVVVIVFGWRDYQGLSIPLALEAMNGSASGQWITKLGLTAFSVGVGFVGGELIPLVVLGSLAGASFGSLVGADVAVFAAIGAVAVLSGAANTPLACTLMGLELFGGSGAVLFAVACAAAYATSGHTGIFHAQRVSAHKGGMRTGGAPRPDRC